MRMLVQNPTWTGLQNVPTPDTGDVADVATINSLVSVFSNIITSVVALTGILLFIMLVIGGFTFLFSGGDQKKLEKAKGTVTNAIIGLIVLLCAYIILLIIKAFTGVDVTNFKLNFIQ